MGLAAVVRLHLLTWLWSECVALSPPREAAIVNAQGFIRREARQIELISKESSRQAAQILPTGGQARQLTVRAAGAAPGRAAAATPQVARGPQVATSKAAAEGDFRLPVLAVHGDELVAKTSGRASQAKEPASAVTFASLAANGVAVEAARATGPKLPNMPKLEVEKLLEQVGSSVVELFAIAGLVLVGFVVGFIGVLAGAFANPQHGNVSHWFVFYSTPMGGIVSGLAAVSCVVIQCSFKTRVIVISIANAIYFVMCFLVGCGGSINLSRTREVRAAPSADTSEVSDRQEDSEEVVVAAQPDKGNDHQPRTEVEQKEAVLASTS